MSETLLELQLAAGAAAEQFWRCPATAGAAGNCAAEQVCLQCAGTGQARTWLVCVCITAGCKLRPKHQLSLANLSHPRNLQLNLVRGSLASAVHAARPYLGRSAESCAPRSCGDGNSPALISRTAAVPLPPICDGKYGTFWPGKECATNAPVECKCSAAMLQRRLAGAADWHTALIAAKFRLKSTEA